MRRFDLTRSLLEQPTEPEYIVKALDGVLMSTDATLSVIPYASREPSNRLFHLIAGRRRDVALRGSGAGIDSFTLTVCPSNRSDMADTVKGAFWVWKWDDTVSILATLDGSDFLARAVLPMFHSHRTYVQRPLLNHSFLTTLLKRFRSAAGLDDLKVERASIRSRYQIGGAKPGTIIPSVSWPALGLEQTLRYAVEQNGWFRSLTFRTQRGHLETARVTVTRDGVIKTTGEWLNVYRHLLRPICEKLSDDLTLYSHRSRRDVPKLGVRPLQIAFEDGVFDEVTERARFVEAMHLLDHASVSVIHNNPYLQLTILDYDDGSHFDIWVLGSSDVLIVPQLRGTASAISRLVGHIFHQFAEGVITDMPARTTDGALP